MMVHGVLFQLEELRQTNGAFGFVHRAGEDHDAGSRGHGVNDFHIQRGLGCPAGHVVVSRIEFYAPDGRENFEGNWRQAELLVKDI